MEIWKKKLQFLEKQESEINYLVHITKFQESLICKLKALEKYSYTTFENVCLIDT